MPILARFTDFGDFYFFSESPSNCIFGNFKILTVNFEIYSFSYLSKIFCFPVTQLYTMKLSEQNIKQKMSDTSAYFSRNLFSR